MSTIVAVLAALIHVYIFYLESFAWENPKTLKVFKMTAEQANVSRDLAFNQGFYNLFLAVAVVIGLSWGERNLVDFGMGSILAAAVVLLIRKPKMLRGASIQGLPALLYFMSRILGF